MNHVNIVTRVRARHALQFSTDPAAWLAFLVELIAELPADEGAGLLRKDAGENIVPYSPAGVMVSMGRICYPSGDLVKVLTDVGPGGANGPQWADDGTVERSRYVPVAQAPETTAVGTGTGMGTTVTPCGCAASITSLERMVSDRLDIMDRSMKQIAARLETIATTPPAAIAWPVYRGETQLTLPLVGTRTVTMTLRPQQS